MARCNLRVRGSAKSAAAFYGCFLVIEAHGGRCFQNNSTVEQPFQYNGHDCYCRTGETYKNNRRTTVVPNSVSYCRAKPFKVLAAAPRPRKRVGSGLRSQIGPLARRGIPGCLRSAPREQYTINSLYQQFVPTVCTNSLYQQFVPTVCAEWRHRFDIRRAPCAQFLVLHVYPNAGTAQPHAAAQRPAGTKHTGTRA